MHTPTHTQTQSTTNGVLSIPAVESGNTCAQSHALTEQLHDTTQQPHIERPHIPCSVRIASLTHPVQVYLGDWSAAGGSGRGDHMNARRTAGL